MFRSHSRHDTVLTSLKICLVLALLFLPFATLVIPTYASQTTTAPNAQGGTSQDNVQILNEVKNSDGTTTVTVRIYAQPNSPNAPNTNFWLSQDTYIASGNPTGNFATATNLRIGYDNSGPHAMRLLMQFNLSSIPSNATVNSATVYMYQFAAVGISNMGFLAQYAVSPWSEFNATWNNSNFIGGATLPVGNFPNTLGWLSINATNLFKTWVSGQQPNYGLIITGNEDPAANSSRSFYSSNYASLSPYVDINYTTGCAYTTPPTSSVNPLPATSPSAFTVSWTGSAYTPPGCAANGITSYVVWYQVNNGSFIKWLDGVTYTSAQFNAASLGIGNGSAVGFRSQAVDNYGNKTPAGDATASTVINIPDTTPPSVTMNALPQYTTSNSFWVSWNGSDTGSGVAYYNLQYQFNHGAWQTLISNTPQNSFYFQNAQTGIYGFRVQAVDKSGNASAWPPGAQTSTTVLVSPLAVIKPFVPAILQSTSPVTKSFNVNWTGYTPPGSVLTTVTIRYRYTTTGSSTATWTLWKTVSATPATAVFDWFNMNLPSEATYQFQATAANNLNQPPYEVPAQYWQIMIVDMQNRGGVNYLPVVLTGSAP